MTAIIVAVVTGIFTLTGTVITVAVGQRKTRSEIETQLDKHNAIQDERIKTLTKQVEKHNQVVERVYRLEEDVKHLEQESHTHV